MITFAAIGITNALVAAIVLLKSKSSNKLANKALALLAVLVAIRIGKVIAQNTDHSVLNYLYFNLMHSAYLLLGPVLLLFIFCSVNPKTRFQSRFLLHSIPGILALLFASAIRESITIESWFWIYKIMLFFPIIYIVRSVLILRKSSFREMTLWGMAGFVSLIVLFNAAFFFFEFPFYVVSSSLAVFFTLILLLRLVEFKTNLALSKSNLNHQPNDEVHFDLFGKYIEKHYADFDLDLNKVSRALDLPRHQLSSVINRQSANSFSQYVIGIRIQKARELLQHDPETKISAIAYEVGFRSISSFNTNFRQREGVSPKVFRDKFR